jgi:thiol-disulfide isomerase/thioredoxin
MNGLSQNRELHIKLDSLRYDSLELKFEFLSGEANVINASILNNKEYLAIIPDSIFESYVWVSIFGKKMENDSCINSKLGWGFVVDEKDLENPKNMGNDIYLFFDDKKDLQLDLELTHRHPLSEDETEYWDMYRFQNFTKEQYLSVKLYSDYRKMRGKSEEEFYNYLKAVFRENYDSQALIRFFSDGKILSSGIKVETLKELYDLLSKKNKNSFFGKHFSDYIERREKFTKFPNIQLPEYKNGKFEYVLQDTTIHNLVVFSASWCGPCHKQIPVLKQIHDDLKNKLAITYISIDKQETVEPWKNLMKEEQIPWRSLLAADNKDEISKIYFVESIPLTYLIYPDGSFEKFDVRDEENRQKLYKIINK